MDALFAAMQPKLQPTPVIFEFLDLMRKTPVFPRPLRGLQRVLLRAAVQLVPATLRQQLRIGREWELRHWERPIVRVAAWLADRFTPRNHPMIEACQRLGLNPKTLFANDSTQPRQLQAKTRSWGRSDEQGQTCRRAGSAAERRLRRGAG
ncbi:oxygenase MpaB family protein [Sinimarinibacterium sp. HSW-8]|uniref:Oxygenase MpaB family protein n=1 Tax=Sinimarinibacterium thermocellulolyticum TaxID=3170016 RepID=A0ABV2ADV1_9GAMM